MRPHRGRAGAHRGARDDLEGTPHPQRDAPSLRDPDAGAVRPVLLGDLKPGLVVRPALPVGPGPSARHQRPHSPGLEERIRRGQQTDRAQGGRCGARPARPPTRDGSRLSALPRAQTGPRAAARRDHPALRAYPLANASVLESAAARDARRDPFRLARLRYRRLPDQPRRPQLLDDLRGERRPCGGRARAGGAGRWPHRLCAGLSDLDRRRGHDKAFVLAWRHGRGAEASRLAPATPHRAHRSNRPVEEHRARFPRLREAACPPPRAQSRVQFWAFLQPSRQDVALYRNYVRKVRQAVQRINAQYGAHGWQPIRLELGESVRKAMAAMRNFDVLIVNSVYDGLNLVAKEGALVNRSDGVIVVSENVGAHEELQPHVLSINPFDIEATANAMHQAIVMGVEEKRRRNEGAREVVRTNDIARWITRQVQDIRDLAAEPGLRAG